nr:fatty acid 2-hydroxylase isoform X1 [Osmia lignaria]
MATTANEARKRTGQLKHEKETTENEEEKFLVSYQKQYYNIRNFLRYHPGGKKVFDYFKNQSLDNAFNNNPHSKGAFHLFEDFKLNNDDKYREYENFIDWNSPILCQVGTLGDRYWEWVNLPVNQQIRLFKSDYLEILSITPWYLIPIVWIPICIFLLYLGWTGIADSHSGNILLEALISYVFGILLWSALEYVLHRKLFHFKPPATSKVLISLHFILHGIHHKAPFDDRRLVFPPVLGLLITKLILYLYHTVFPPQMVYFISAGTATGYLCYDLIHYYLHHGAPKVGSYFYLLKRNHNYHHFLHHELGNILSIFEMLDKFIFICNFSPGFGISSKLWDYAFGTTICLRKLKKPIEW